MKKEIETYAEAIAECQRLAPASSWAYLEIPWPWVRHVVSFARGVNASGLAINAAKIEEKHGGLEIAYATRPGGGRHPRIDALIESAQDACFSTCQDCGDRGHLVSVRRVLSVLCKPCREEREAAT